MSLFTRIPVVLAGLVLVIGRAPTASAEGPATYVGDDPGRCEIFRALSDQVPEECEIGVPKTVVINPPAQAPSRPAAAPRRQAAPPPRPRQARAQRPRRPAAPQRRRTSSRPAARVAAPAPREIPSGERAMAIPIGFANESARLTQAARTQLDNIAAVLNDPLLRGLVVRIEGHASATGADDYNLRLSRRRAAAVQDYLSSRHGIERARIPAAGKGESQPYDQQRPTAAINRRVEFVNTGLLP